MRIETVRLYFPTEEGASLADVTADVDAFIRDAALTRGLCILTVPGDGCCLTLTADLDEDVDDLLRIVRTHLVPGLPDAAGTADRVDVDDSGYPAAGVIADSLTVSIRAGGMNLGSWDGIVLLDARGPRTCPLDVTLAGA